MTYKFRDLRADEIECRVQSVDKNGKWVNILLYKNARCDMNILDETVGPENWQRDHKELKGNIYCGISIWDEGKRMWITKWDCGKESNTEAEKGEASDSFKRAGFNWGIGRELYTAPAIFLRTGFELDGFGKCKTTFDVSNIEITDKKITKLKILSNKGETVFYYEESAGDKSRREPQATRPIAKEGNEPKTGPEKPQTALDEYFTKAALLDDDDLKNRLDMAILTDIDGRPLGDWYKNKGRQFILDYYNSEDADPKEKWSIAVIEESIRRKQAKK